MDNSCVFAFYCYLRAVLIAFNEYIIFRIAFCTNIGEDRALGLIVNFGSTLIICELDDLIMGTGRIQYWREYFDKMPVDSEEPKKDEEAAAGENQNLIKTEEKEIPPWK